MASRLAYTAAIICAAWIFVSPGAADDLDTTTLQLRLTGTVKTPNGGIAFCIDPATGQPLSIKVGEKFSGWELRSIHDGAATFVNEVSAQATIRISSPVDGRALVVSPSVPASSTVPSVGPAPLAVPSGRWVDGDGQMISPPVERRR
jgi:hypothetical protein